MNKNTECKLLLDLCDFGHCYNWPKIRGDARDLRELWVNWKYRSDSPVTQDSKYRAWERFKQGIRKLGLWEADWRHIRKLQNQKAEERERELISSIAKARATHAERNLRKAEAGFVPHTRHVFGYRHGRTLKPNQDSPIVKQLFEEYLRGLSLRNCADRAGIKSSQAVLNILRNPIYCGRFRYKGKVYQGRHEPIVSIDIFETTGRLLDENGRGHQYNWELAESALETDSGSMKSAVPDTDSKAAKEEDFDHCQ